MNKNVLIFPCGSEIGLEIHNALKYVKGLTLYGGSSIKDHGTYVYKNYIGDFPNIDAEDFIDFLNDMISKFDIDFIIPAHDSVVLKLAQYQNSINAIVVTSSKETCEIARSKKLTYQFFEHEDFVPKMYTQINEIDTYPVFLKPDVGQGSKGVAKANNKEELLFYKKQNKDLIVLEYLPGEEYTIDCFTDKHGSLKFAGKRVRKRIKSGISVNSVTLPLDEEVKRIARIINEKIEFRGAWFFQLKKDKNNKYKLLEIAPRIAGTMGLHRNKGINFPLLSLYDRMDYAVEITNNNFEVEVDRALINRFELNISYKRVYVDFDDTITYREKVNPMLMLFLYQCSSKGIELILITKHVYNIRETLEALKISPALFDEIIHLNKQNKKSESINNDLPAIFIDDSFAERSEIYNFNIPVFDIDAVESLIDWRQ
ncbi:ATP-grasp domain-containing protein [Bacillus subtilis]|uniref:ATP-grasp domain-containing protein n=1 Tax=Bacillus subtilis group TaxID=653685 RepID=UPI000A11A618|nr:MULTISPECIES: ATP-grasp domain-containing protein [Bacillus subtilis group]MEC2197331.1 ATP-grasp domain-containing protein [Bacillus subtilis]MEC2333674.1 ATP-grasp domain-containing protein [Bacillus subtilis]WNW22842.1 ATP-grasp domain-containing protein [Bacillus inaquosorum]